MEIIQIEAGPVATIGYLVYDRESRQGLIIDTPPDSAGEFIKYIDTLGVEVKYIVLTHTHWDHTADCGTIKEHTKAPVLVHKADEYRLLDPMNHTVFFLPFSLEPLTPDKYLNEGDVLKCGCLEFEIIHTPGHTEGCICLVEHNEKTVFSGDTLFQASIGRTDLPGGDSWQIIDSINNKLMRLPDDYIVYAGHGDKTDIGSERRTNPFLNGEFYI